jgi:UDP-4-amino-4,6-dideoxy-N-acetyl-beta-L-altrosamine N-acetyltransferase
MLKFGRLRSVRSEELELILSWRNMPNVRENMYTRHKISIDEHLVWWKHVQKDSSQKYFIYELTGVALGVVGFNEIDIRSNNSSWAFYASPGAPKGTGSKMEFLALEYAFNQLGLHKLYCEVLAFNVPVIKLHEKFGFKVEGVMREHHKVGENFVDIYRLGILSREWAEKKKLMQEKLESVS